MKIRNDRTKISIKIQRINCKKVDNNLRKKYNIYMKEKANEI